MSLLLALAAAAAPLSTQVDQVASRAGLAGEILVARGDAVLLDQGYGTVAPSGGARHRPGRRWRLASITKQVTATLVLKAVDSGRFTLDTPVAPLLGRPALGAITVRQLLTHHSGLRNPDSTPAGADGVAGFYKAAKPDLAYCLDMPAGPPGGDFSYNNCDYIALGALLEKTGGKPYAATLPPGLTVAPAGAMFVPGYIKGKAEPTLSLAAFGPAGALSGTARGLLAFDRALMKGKLLSPASREALWRGDPKQGYQALGQWSFPGTLKGCTAPKRIVQRDGEIEGVQTRNYILPDDDLVVIVFTNRSSDDFAIGEIWQRSGFAYDLLSAVACG